MIDFTISINKEAGGVREKLEQLRADLIAYKASGKGEVSPDLVIVRLNAILEEEQDGDKEKSGAV